MSLWFRRVIIFVCSLLLDIGCTSTYSAKNQVKEPEASQTVSPLEEKVPLELWSPAKRKSNASYYYLVGEYEALSRNYGKARRLFENAYNLDPNPFLAAKFIEMNANDDLDQALTLSRKMVLLYPQNPSIQTLYGKLLSATGDSEKAILHLKKSLEIDPQNIESFVYIIQILQSQKKYREAISFAEKMLKVSPDMADGWMELSRLQLLSNQTKRALESARKAYELNALDPEKVHLYAAISEYLGDFKRAASLYDEMLSLDPTNDELIIKIAGIYNILGSTAETLKRFESTEKRLGKKVSGISLMRAFCLWDAQRFDEASAQLDDLAQIYSQSERIVYMSGLGQERTRQFDRALATYRSLDPSAELYSLARYRVIEILRQRGEISKAIDESKEVVNSGAERAIDFYPILGNLLNGERRFAEALAILEDGYKKYPERSDFLFLKAISLEKMGSIDDCIKTLKQLIKINPKNAAALNYIGYIYAEKGINLLEAEQYILRALEIKPDDGYYMDSLGWVYYQKGEYEKALEVLKKANELAGNEAVILEHIADTLLELDRSDEALKYLEKAANGKGEDKDLERIKAKFDRVKSNN